MLAIARRRKEILTSQGLSPRIYGENELGGLHVLTLLEEEASLFGLPEKPRKPTEKIIWRWLLGIIPGLAILAGIGGYLFKTRSESPVESEAKEGGE